MRELELAVYPSIDPGPGRVPRASFSLSRQAFVVSIAVHVLAGIALSRHVWPSAPLDGPIEGFLFEMAVVRPVEPVPATPPAEPAPEAREPEPVPAPRPAQPLPQPTVVVESPPAIEPLPAAEAEPAVEPPSAAELAPALTPRGFIDFDEERQRAAREAVEARATQKQYLTFSVDDRAPPRPEPEPERRSIFDGAGTPIGPNVGQVGQARTKFGQKVSSFCNALTGGFSLMGFGSFCAGPSGGEPSGLFPEVRPAYLDQMPECVDTRDTAPALALEAPFPTVKCRMVDKKDFSEEP
jgi:hypothetical protein